MCRLLLFAVPTPSSLCTGSYVQASAEYGMPVCACRQSLRGARSSAWSLSGGSSLPPAFCPNNHMLRVVATIRATPLRLHRKYCTGLYATNIWQLDINSRWSHATAMPPMPPSITLLMLSSCWSCLPAAQAGGSRGSNKQAQVRSKLNKLVYAC